MVPAAMWLNTSVSPRTFSSAPSAKWYMTAGAVGAPDPGGGRGCA